MSEIADSKNDYNLNIPRYIDSSEPEDLQDLSAHLNGGIPNRDIVALQKYWDALPSLKDALFEPLREGYSSLKVDLAEVQDYALHRSGSTASGHRSRPSSTSGSTPIVTCS